jgi:hypothetical protein
MSLEMLKDTLGLGARANKYRISLNVADGQIEDVLCKATSLPDLTLGTVEVWNQGRKMFLAGETQFAGTWDVTFYNTSGLELRSVFIAKIETIDSYKTAQKSVSSNSEYMMDISVSQLDSLNNETAQYTLHNAFPTVISAVDLAADTADSVTEFTVTFAYSHWTQTK